jgi:hypothetical protein
MEIHELIPEGPWDDEAEEASRLDDLMARAPESNRERAAMTEEDTEDCDIALSAISERGMNPAQEGIYAAREDDRQRAETDALEIEKERVFGTCGGKCGEKPCIEWNKAHRRLRNEPLTLTFDVEHPGDVIQSLRCGTVTRRLEGGYSDRVTVTVDSGDPGGQRATNLREETSWEFAEEMQRFLSQWFDGAAVGLRPANLPKNAYPVARKGQIEYMTVPED